MKPFLSRDFSHVYFNNWCLVCLHMPSRLVLKEKNADSNSLGIYRFLFLKNIFRWIINKILLRQDHSNSAKGFSNTLEIERHDENDLRLFSFS